MDRIHSYFQKKKNDLIVLINFIWTCLFVCLFVCEKEREQMKEGDRDMWRFDKGLKFVMYSYVLIETTIKLKKEAKASFLENSSDILYSNQCFNNIYDYYLSYWLVYGRLKNTYILITLLTFINFPFIKLAGLKIWSTIYSA